MQDNRGKPDIPSAGKAIFERPFANSDVGKLATEIIQQIYLENKQKRSALSNLLRSTEQQTDKILNAFLQEEQSNTENILLQNLKLHHTNVIDFVKGIKFDIQKPELKSFKPLVPDLPPDPICPETPNKPHIITSMNKFPKPENPDLDTSSFKEPHITDNEFSHANTLIFLAVILFIGICLAL